MKVLLKVAACYLIASIACLQYLKWPDYAGHAHVPFSGFPEFLVWAPTAPFYLLSELADDPRSAVAGLIVFGTVLAGGLWLLFRSTQQSVQDHGGQQGEQP